MDVFALRLLIQEEGAKTVDAAIAKLRASMKQTEKDAVGMDKAFEGLTSRLKGLATVAGLGLALKAVADATAESQYKQAQLASALKSTGAAAGQTLDSLNAHADALMKMTAYDDEAINGAQSLLLTFTKIRGDVFPKATEAVLDVAQAMGGDLQGAAIQVGKALNDPMVGMTALQRVGVSFTAAQKEQIQTLVQAGDLYKAQAIILKELQTEFGGSARAARDTLGGALKSLGNSFQNLLEVTKDDSQGVVDSINRMARALDGLKIVMDEGKWWSAFVGGLKYAANEVFPGLLDAMDEMLDRLASIRPASEDAGRGLEKLGFLGKGTGGALANKPGAFGLFDATMLATTQQAVVAVKKTQEELNAEHRAYIDNLVALAGLAPITSKDFAALTTEQARLAKAYAQGNQSMAQRLELAKQLSAVEKALGGATVKRTMSEELAQKKVGLTPQGDGSLLFGFGSEGISPDKVTMPMRKSLEAPLTALQAFQQQLVAKGLELKETIRETFAIEMGTVLGNSIASGFQAAFSTGKIGEGFKALTTSLLGGLGDMLVQFGMKALLASEMMQAFFKAMSLDPTGTTSAAAALAMIALGASLKGAAASIFGGGGGSGGGSISMGGRTASGTGSVTLPGVTFGPTMAMAGAGVSAMAPVNVTLIGPNDPSAQRAMQELLRNANRRGTIL